MKNRNRHDQCQAEASPWATHLIVTVHFDGLVAKQMNFFLLTTTFRLQLKLGLVAFVGANLVVVVAACMRTRRLFGGGNSSWRIVPSESSTTTRHLDAHIGVVVSVQSTDAEHVVTTVAVAKMVLLV